MGRLVKAMDQAGRQEAPPVLGSGLMGRAVACFGRMRLIGEGLEPVGEVDTVEELLRLEEQHE
jgi:hypothetical protein